MADITPESLAEIRSESLADFRRNTQSFWRDAQFNTIRVSLLKVAARVTEMATRIKIALPSSYPYPDSWMLLAQRAARRPP
jgi:hypothetical protein